MKLRNRFTPAEVLKLRRMMAACDSAEVAKLRRMMAAFDSAEAKLQAARDFYAGEQAAVIRPPVVFLDKEPLEPLDVDAQHGQEF